MKTKNHILPLAALAGLALFAAPANADVIQPTTATVAVGGSTNTNITSTIDGSGLSGVGDILTQTHDFSSGQWISGNGTSPNVEVVFDLGGTFTVDSVHLWNFHWSNNVVHWGTKTMDISFSTDGGSNYTGTVQDLAFTQAVQTVPVPAQTQTFAAVSGVTHIKVSDLVYHGSPFVGFAEIRFGGSAAPPADPVLSQDLVNGDPDLDFGTVVDSAPFSESRTVRFVNDGPTNAIEITATTDVSGDAAYSLADIAVNGSGGLSLPQSLAVGDYIEFTVAASLAAPATGVTGNLVIDTNADDQDQNLPITGTFTEPIDPVLNQDLVNADPDLDFGTVVGSAPFSESRTVRFENDGPTNAIEISTASVSGDAAYSLSDITVNGGGGVSLPQSLAVGDYIEFTVAASLAAPASGVTGNLVIDTDAAGQDENLPITGTFTEPSPIITPTTATVVLGGSTNTNITSTIDGSGLSGVGDILTQTHDHGSGQWISGNGTSPNVEVVFDLGGTFTVDSVHLWNFNWSNGVTHWGTQTLDISFSSDGVNFSNTVQDLAFTENVHPNPIPAQTQTFAAVSGVTHIKVSDLVYHGSPYVGFAEIRFGHASGSGGNDFSDWIAGYSVGGQTGIDDDPDLDGVDSGVENFFGTAPDTFTQGLVSGAVDTGANTFTFTHPQTGSIADDLTATYEWSVDLDNFFADGVANGGLQVDFGATPDTPSAGTTTVVATVTGPVPEKLFVNVAVTQN